MSKKLTDYVVGDKITRMIGNTVPMTVTITAITPNFIEVNNGAWLFHKDTGGEVDTDLGWDGVTITGSILRP